MRGIKTLFIKIMVKVRYLSSRLSGCLTGLQITALGAQAPLRLSLDFTTRIFPHSPGTRGGPTPMELGHMLYIKGLLENICPN